jgi:hypothetical protein
VESNGAGDDRCMVIPHRRGLLRKSDRAVTAGVLRER